MDPWHDIVEKCRKNDQVAQHQLYKMLAPKLLGLSVRYTRSRFEAEDYVQEAFIKIFTHLDAYKGEGSFEGWARRITVNVILKDMQKKNVLKHSMDIEEHWDAGSHSYEISSSIGHQELLAIINKLPEGQKLVFNLFVIEGYEHKEIAEMLGISEGTSKSQLAKAKQKIIETHKHLNSEYVDKIS